MTIRTPKYLPRRISEYVPAMAYVAGVIHGSPYEVVFGPVANASAANILSAQSIATAGSTTTFVNDNTDPVIAAQATEFPNGPGFGRCLQFVASGASTSTVTVTGRDYLGQPMVETITLNGTTVVNGNKAFKWIDRIAWSGTAATTINVGTTNKLGLPYRAVNVLAEQSDKARVATLGTFVAAAAIDPQTATANDPRGVYTPNTTPDGSKRLSAVFVLDPSLNSNGNGGLHGIAHYVA